MENNAATQPVDLLEDIEQDYQYEDASTGLRFANYIIDLVVFFIVVLAFFFFWTLVAGDVLATWVTELPFPMDRIFGLALFGSYVAIVEGFSKGRSPGKLITGTQAVRSDNKPFSWTDALGRGASRMVPFEPFSALWGNPWHDKWTDTRVVKTRR